MESENKPAVGETDQTNNPAGPDKESRCCRDSCSKCGHRPCGRCGRRHRWLFVLLLIGIIAFFARGAYYGYPWDCGSRYQSFRPHASLMMSAAPYHAEWLVDRMMDDVKASDEQRSKARAIVKAAASDMQALFAQHRDGHDALLDIVKAPALDRGQLETLRARTVSGMDESSKRLTTAFGDLLEVLTPEQRQELAARFEYRFR